MPFEMCVCRSLCYRQKGARHTCLDPQDLVKETAGHYKKARKFFDTLAAQLVRQGHTLDVFACSLDQVPPPPPPRGDPEDILCAFTSPAAVHARALSLKLCLACLADLLCR